MHLLHLAILSVFAAFSIARAQEEGILVISPPQNYELLNPTSPTIIYKNSPVPDSSIIFEYKREGEGDAAYSLYKPNRIGNWIVRGTLPATVNYTEATDAKTFKVTRGNSIPVSQKVEFAEEGFEKDTAFSRNPHSYYVAGTILCGITNAVIQITVYEPDIVLSISKIPQRELKIIENPVSVYYEIPIGFGKPRLDTLIYTLLSKDNIYSENDTIIIETPIPFHSVVGQKWNNVLFVNNNPQTNGGYEFTEFKWFQNNYEIGSGQFYSAGPSSKDALNPNDIYKVSMQTADGIRISTCESSPKSAANKNAAAQKTTKRVLGISSETVNPNAKIYNSKGELISRYKPGVYILTDN